MASPLLLKKEVQTDNVFEYYNACPMILTRGALKKVVSLWDKFQ